MADHRWIDLSGGTLSYLIAGHGPEKVILFHGAGQHNGSFPFLQDEVCLQRFTFYSVDLFFHGESKWLSSHQVLEKETWKQFILTFFEQEKIDQCSVVGFSLGARFALATVECFPSPINRLILLAPDGLKFHFVYRLAVSNILMRSIFKHLMIHPQALSIINQIAHKIGLTDKTTHRLVEKQTDKHEKRMQLYNSWVVFRQLKFKPSELASVITQHTIPVVICSARQDSFVNKKALQQFINEVGGRYIEMDTHHLGVLRECKSLLMQEP